MPQRAVVRLLRYLRSLMLNDCTPDVSAGAGAKDGAKDSHAAPSLQRVVEWCSICMDAVGLQVGALLCCCTACFVSVSICFARAGVTPVLQLATTQEGREICAGLKRAVQVRRSVFARCHFVTLSRRCSSKLPSPWAACTASCSKYAPFPVLPVAAHSQFSYVPCPLPPLPPLPPVDGASENAVARPTSPQHRARASVALVNTSSRYTSAGLFRAPSAAVAAKRGQLRAYRLSLREPLSLLLLRSLLFKASLSVCLSLSFSLSYLPSRSPASSSLPLPLPRSPSPRRPPWPLSRWRLSLPSPSDLSAKRRKNGVR
jgi:hypothetical protein